jgi:DnaK suppressor protein
MEFEQVREQLLGHRARLEHEIRSFDSDLTESSAEASDESAYDQHMAETAAVTLDREIELTLEENARGTLALIERALSKLDDGTYGACDSCGREIGAERLEVTPWANLCIDCKRREERGR